MNARDIYGAAEVGRENRATFAAWEQVQLSAKDVRANFSTLRKESGGCLPVLIQSIHFTFSSEDADRVAGLLRELWDLSREEPGVVRFDVARGKDHPNVFALWEEYRDEAALKAHVGSEHYRRLVIGGVRPLAKERLGEMVLPLE